MTIPYNAKPFSNRQYIRDAFKDIDIDVENEELTTNSSSGPDSYGTGRSRTDESNEMDRIRGKLTQSRMELGSVCLGSFSGFKLRND